MGRDPMTAWTRQKPAKPGWYWWRAESSATPCVFRVDQDHIQRENLITLGRAILYLDEMPGEWQGPIEPEA